MDSDPSFVAAIESSERLPLVAAGPMPTPDSMVLFILCSYPRENVARGAGLPTRLTLGLLDVLTCGWLRPHRRLYRNHYANPRSLAYLVGLARRFRQQAELKWPPDLIVDRDFGVDAASIGSGFGRVELADLHDSRQAARICGAAAGHHDAIILVWPDALGLGWESLQRRVAGSPLIMAMNGRRRVFPLDGSTRRALSLRRYFAHTRLAELAFALCICPVAAVCALIDAVKRP